MPSKAALAFRVVAVAEAFSWSGLLIGMFFKYVLHAGEGGVPVLGMVHGIIFVLYLLTTLVAAKVLGWSLGTVFFGLIASVPPLFTWFFEKWTLRTGKLDAPEMNAYRGTGLFAVEPSTAAA